MRANLSLLFYLKRRNCEKTGPVPVYLRITVDNKRAELAIGHKCEPEKWSNAAGKMIGTKESVREFNASLEELQRKIHAIADRLEREEEIITAEGLKMVYLGKASSHRMILEIFGEHNRKAKALVGNGFAPGTIERYKTSFKHTKEFIQSKYRVDDLAVSRINHAFIAEYEFFLRSVRGCGNNTTVKYLNNFKKITRICLGNGWMTRDPFINHKLRTKIVDRGFLNEQELKRMAEHVFEVQRLNTVRDIFLFSCYTIFTPNYKLKADNRAGGVGYEYSILNATLYKNQVVNDKIIPVLRSGAQSTSIPDFMHQYIHIDFTEDKQFESSYLELNNVVKNIPFSLD